MVSAESLSLFLIVLGSIAAFASFTVVLTVLIFPSMIKRKLFVHTIVLISLSDFCANFVLAWGFPTSKLSCEWQAILLNFCLRSSWCWTVFLSLNLHSIVMNGRPLLSLKQMHALAWSINVLLEVLPLTTQAHYGEDDHRDGNTICYIANGNNRSASRAWEMVTFSLPLIVSMCILFFCNIRICCKYRDQDARVLNKFPTINSVVGMLWLYPVCMIVTWLPHLVISLLFNGGLELPPMAVDPGLLVTFGWGSLYGVCLAAIFFIKGSEARRRWHDLLCGKTTSYTYNRNAGDGAGDNPMPNTSAVRGGGGGGGGVDNDDSDGEFQSDFSVDLDERGNISRNQSYLSMFDGTTPLLSQAQMGEVSEQSGSIQSGSILTQLSENDKLSVISINALHNI